MTSTLTLQQTTSSSTTRTKAATRIIKHSLNILTIPRRRKQPTHLISHTKQNSNNKKNNNRNNNNNNNNNNNKPARHQIFSPKLHFVEYLHRTSTRALPRPRRLASAGWSDHSKQLLWIASTVWGMRHPFKQFLKHIWLVMSRVHLPHPSVLRKTNKQIYVYI